KTGCRSSAASRLRTRISYSGGTVAPGQPTHRWEPRRPRSAAARPPGLPSVSTFPSAMLTWTGRRFAAMTRSAALRWFAGSILRGVEESRSACQTPRYPFDTSFMSRILGIVGNCSYNALVSDGSVEWLCWPRPDSSFVFGRLLDREQGGAFVVEGIDIADIRQ